MGRGPRGPSRTPPPREQAQGLAARGLCSCPTCPAGAKHELAQGVLGDRGPPGVASTLENREYAPHLRSLQRAHILGWRGAP